MPDHASDEAFLRRAIKLAMKSRGDVEPNPMVGCVITAADGNIIGAGRHEKWGGPHAEPNALASCIEDPRGGTAYVTLEPCCHTDKKTPPCVPALLSAGLARVVLGCLDPNPKVNGNGVAQLRAAGVEVTTGVLEAECQQLLAPFIAKVDHERPYVTLKWAETSDGKVAGPGGKRLQISGPAATRAVHALRARSEAILVGAGTASTDDPLLTPRDVAVSRNVQRLRVVLDSRLRIGAGARLLADESGPPVRVYHATGGLADRIRAMTNLGIDLRTLPPAPTGTGLSIAHLFEDLADEPITHLLVEPGPTLARGFFASGLVDRLWVIRSKVIVSDESAPAAPAVPAGFVETGTVSLGDDVLSEYLNPRSAVYFAPEPSADLVLARDAAAAGSGS